MEMSCQSHRFLQKEFAMIISIVACAKRSSGVLVIGKNHALPWHLPQDLQWFRKHTLGKTVMMGRKTFESLPVRPLPGRDMIVVTNNKEWSHPGVEVCHDPMRATEKYLFGPNDLYVAGGGEIYRRMLPWTQKIIMTVIDHEVDGDTIFPLDHQDLFKYFAEKESSDHQTEVNPEKWNGKSSVSWRHSLFVRTP
jgi:dihydrofolate reductase